MFTVLSYGMVKSQVEITSESQIWSLTFYWTQITVKYRNEKCLKIISIQIVLTQLKALITLSFSFISEVSPKANVSFFLRKENKSQEMVLFFFLLSNAIN